MPTYTVVNRDRSYSPDRRPSNDHYDEPRDLDARLREMAAPSPELPKPRVYVKDDFSSRGSPKEYYPEKSTYKRDDRSPDGYPPDEKYRNETSSRDYQESSSSRKKESYSDSYQKDPPRHRSSERRQRDSPVRERQRSKEGAKYSSPPRYSSPEPERQEYRKSDSKIESSSSHRRSRRDDDDKYDNDREKKDDRKSDHRDRSSHHGSSGNHRGNNSSGRDAPKSNHRSSSRHEGSSKSKPDRDEERRQSSEFDPTLVIIPRRKDEGRGGIFNRPEIRMRPITDDPDNQSFEEKRVVAVLPGKKLPAEPSLSDADFRRDYLELLARKGLTSGGYEIGARDKYGDLGLGAPPTLSSRFQGASSLDFLTTLESLELNRAKNLERELELRREMEILRDRSPLRLSNTTAELEERLNMIERKVVEPNKPRDLRHDLESRRKQLKKTDRVSSRLETAISPRRAVAKKSEKESKLRMTSADRRPVRERLGMSPAKKTRRSLDRRGSPDELPDFKKEVEEIQKAEWMADPKSVPKGDGYFEVSEVGVKKYFYFLMHWNRFGIPAV